MVALLEDLGLSSSLVAHNDLERHLRDLMVSFDLKGNQAHSQCIGIHASKTLLKINKKFKKEKLRLYIRKKSQNCIRILQNVVSPEDSMF